MRFRFLGTGTSSGVPAIACDCAVCTSTDPRDRRLRTGASIEFTDTRGVPRVILIDATPDLRQQALAANLRRCDAILFTHNHVDHVFGLDEVRRFNAVQKSPIEVFAEPHTLDSLRRVYQHIFDADRNVNDSFVATLIARTIQPEQSIELFGMRCTPIRLLHGKLPIVGFRIEPTKELARTHQTLVSPFPLAYCTDVSAIPPESWRLLHGVRTLVLDALRYRKHPTHMTIDEAVNTADRIAADATWFIHMSHDLPHEQTNAALPESMRLAHDGLVLG